MLRNDGSLRARRSAATESENGLHCCGVAAETSIAVAPRTEQSTAARRPGALMAGRRPGPPTVEGGSGSQFELRTNKKGPHEQLARTLIINSQLSIIN